MCQQHPTAHTTYNVNDKFLSRYFTYILFLRAFYSAPHVIIPNTHDTGALVGGAVRPNVGLATTSCSRQ